MAHSTSFFTRRSGSTKSHTYQRRAGTQITQDVREEVKNPRTLSQMEHRCLVHTMADAHTWLSPLFGNLWEGAKSAYAYMAKFREANFALLKDAAFSGRAGWTFSPYKVTTRPLGYFQVAAGSLPYKANFFHNALMVDNSVAIDLFNYTQEDKLWGDVLNAAGLKINDTLRLYIMLYNTETQRGHVDVADIKLTGFPDIVIGEQLWEEIAAVSFRQGSYAWVTRNNKPRGFQLYYQDSSIDWQHTVVMTMCIQIAKQGGRSYNSDGYLWHYYEHIVGMHFREAVETYPRDGGSVLTIPEADEDLYVDLGLPSGLLWATRNIDATQKNGFAKSAFQYECSFFSWGNIDAHNPTGVATFTPWSWGSGTDTEPYQSSPGSEIIFPDNIERKNDAAYNICGENWRMPTNNDFAELLANTIFIDSNGDVIEESNPNKIILMPKNNNAGFVNGVRLRSKNNGNILFFPCCGSGNVSNWVGKADTGRYWSSNCYSQTIGFHFFISSTSINANKTLQKYFGFPIRPVQVPSRGRKSIPEEKDPVKDIEPTK